MLVRRHERSIEAPVYCSLVRFQKVSKLQVVLLASSEWLPALRCSRGRSVEVQHWESVDVHVCVCVNKAHGAQWHYKHAPPSWWCDSAGEPRPRVGPNSWKRVLWGDCADSSTWSRSRAPLAHQGRWKIRCEIDVSGELVQKLCMIVCVCLCMCVCVCFLYLLLERTPTESEAKALTASVSSQSLVWAARWDRPTDPLLAFTLCQYWPVTSTHHHRSHHSDMALVPIGHTNPYDRVQHLHVRSTTFF